MLDIQYSPTVHTGYKLQIQSKTFLHVQSDAVEE